MSPFEIADIAKLEFWIQGLQFGSVLTLVMLFLFQVKHMVMDFFVQNRFPYMWMNKHLIWHPGGWLHSGTHAVASFGIFALIHPPTTGAHPWWEIALYLCIGEFYLHFLIDCVKMRIGIWKGWKCNTSPRFWDLLGIDQFLHQVTYLVMILVWVVR